MHHSALLRVVAVPSARMCAPPNVANTAMAAKVPKASTASLTSDMGETRYPPIGSMLHSHASRSLMRTASPPTSSTYPRGPTTTSSTRARDSPV